MTLEGLEKIGDIGFLQSNDNEIHGLMKKAWEKLNDSKAENISKGTRFVQAYNVILLCATALLRSHNYRVENKLEKHYVTIQTLRHTLNLDLKKINYLQSLREKRHETCIHHIS